MVITETNKPEPKQIMFKRKPQKYFVAWILNGVPDSAIMEFSELPSIQRVANRIIIGENALTGEMYEERHVVITCINKL